MCKIVREESNVCNEPPSSRTTDVHDSLGASKDNTRVKASFGVLAMVRRPNFRNRTRLYCLIDIRLSDWSTNPRKQVWIFKLYGHEN